MDIFSAVVMIGFILIIIVYLNNTREIIIPTNKSKLEIITIIASMIITLFITFYYGSELFHYLIGFRLSYTIKAHIKDYYDAFKECNSENNLGDLTPFIIMFLNIILESFENLYDALEKRQNQLLKYSKIIAEKSSLSKELGDFAFILVQSALFADEGITKKQLGNALNISPSTVDKRLGKLRQMGLLLEESGKPSKYSIDLNKLS